MKLQVFLLILILSLSASPSKLQAALPETETQEIDQDPYGIWQLKPRDFKDFTRQGGNVVDMPEEKTFFTYWIPPRYTSGRIIVSIHGTGGNPYIAMRDEFKTAAEYDYLPIAISWFSKERGFFPAKDLYRNILQALNFIQKKTGNSLTRIGYIGFSRGAAVSYEVAALDAKSENIIDLFISHSGGIPLNANVEAKNPNSKPDPFFSQLINGELGKKVFKGKNFFLYSGDQDESWGITMSLQMENAKKLIEIGGGQVLEWIREPHDGHMGFLRNPSIKAKALKYFVELTP